jgi:hypothetical protein
MVAWHDMCDDFGSMFNDEIWVCTERALEWCHVAALLATDNRDRSDWRVLSAYLRGMRMGIHYATRKPTT